MQIRVRTSRLPRADAVPSERNLKAMNESLKERCDLLIQNEAVLRKSARLDFEEMSKLAALIFTSRGQHANEARIRECRALLKQKVNVFSNWRGIMNTVVLTKMTLAEDPEKYFDGIQAVYEKLTKGTILQSEYQAMCAMTIYDQCEPERIDETVERTLAQYARSKQAHPILTGHEDLTLIALMVMAGADVEMMNDRAEECLALVKPLFKLHPETKQTIAHVLALSDKPAQQKVYAFWDLYQGLVATKHNMSRNRMIAILAAFVDLDVPRDQLVAEIGEVDLYLKGNKGYGVIGVGAKFRRMMAAILVLQEHEDELGVERANAAGTAIAEVIAEEIIQAIIMIIVISAINAANSSSH